VVIAFHHTTARVVAAVVRVVDPDLAAAAEAEDPRPVGPDLADHRRVAEAEDLVDHPRRVAAVEDHRRAEDHRTVAVQAEDHRPHRRVDPEAEVVVEGAEVVVVVAEVVEVTAPGRTI
jgi:hypothetical protein